MTLLYNLTMGLLAYLRNTNRNLKVKTSNKTTVLIVVRAPCAFLSCSRVHFIYAYCTIFNERINYDDDDDDDDEIIQNCKTNAS